MAFYFLGERLLQRRFWSARCRKYLCGLSAERSSNEAQYVHFTDATFWHACSVNMKLSFAIVLGALTRRHQAKFSTVVSKMLLLQYSMMELYQDNTPRQQSQHRSLLIRICSYGFSWVKVATLQVMMLHGRALQFVRVILCNTVSAILPSPSSLAVYMRSSRSTAPSTRHRTRFRPKRRETEP